MEALQFLKCLFHKELLFREPPPSSVLKEELEGVVEDDRDSE